MSEVGKLKQEVDLLRQKLAEQVGIVHTADEEYELRLQQSFEEKEKACAELAERLKQHQQQVGLQHQQRRAQSTDQGYWLQVLSTVNPAWQGNFFERLNEVWLRQRDAEEKAKRSEAFISVVTETIE